MTTIKGPAVFLAQFIGDAAPFNSLDGICAWAAGLGFKGVQIPTLDAIHRPATSSRKQNLRR